MSIGLPALFIGSSVEGVRTAYAILQAPEHGAESTVWSQGMSLRNHVECARIAPPSIASVGALGSHA